jgi:hypothetical protein
VTFTNSGSGGLVGGLGASYELGTMQAGAQATVGGSIKFTAGKSWSFRDKATADAFVKRYGRDQDLVRHVLNHVRRLCFFCGMLGIGSQPTPPPADQTSIEGGASLSFGAEVSAVWGADVKDELAGAIGHVDDHRTGEQTLSLRVSDTAGGDAFAAAGIGATAGVSGLAQLKVDRRGKPLALTVEYVTTRALLSQAPAQQQPGGGSGSAVKDLHGDGRVTEVESDLDLTDPANAAAALRFLRGADIGGFSRWVDRHGSTTMRTYASEDGRGGAGATLALGAEVGGGYSHTSQKLRLTGVYTRLPGLGFLPRADCLER